MAGTHILHRFVLTARQQGDPSAAKSMWNKNLQWRKENQIDSILHERLLVPAQHVRFMQVMGLV
jgi:hypothetical protein